MNQRQRLQRMVKAAEAWGNAHLPAPVSVGTVQEPVCCEDGALQTTIELQSAGRPQRVHCLVTLEPNGVLSCFAPDTGTPSLRT